jgi:hypothetical protein
MNPKSANLAVLSFEEGLGFAIETVSVDSQSCNLSGAWDFEDLEDASLKDLLFNRLLIVSGVLEKESMANRFAAQKVEISTFILDAAQEAESGVILFNNYLERNAKEYEEYMAVPPVERKLLPKVAKKKLEPINAHAWEMSFDEARPELTLRQLGKRESIEGTPPSMKRLIATSWLIKHLVDRWRDDETERTSRSYLYPEGRDFQILPSSWMESLDSLQEAIRR